MSEYIVCIIEKEFPISIIFHHLQVETDIGNGTNMLLSCKNTYLSNNANKKSMISLYKVMLRKIIIPILGNIIMEFGRPIIP